MVVVDVTSFFSSSCGGIKRYYQEKSRWLPRLGVECHFVVPAAARSEEPFGEGTLHRLPGPSMPGNGAYRLFGFRAGLAPLLARLRPDVIEVGSHYLLPAWLERLARRLETRPRLVGFFHSHPRQVVENVARFLPAGLGAEALAALAWRFFRRQHERYRANLVASPAIADLLAARGIPRISWVGLGVDVDVFAPTARVAAAPMLTYAGRFTADKELPVLLRAFDRIHAATGARLRLVGDGPLRGRLEAYATSRPAVSVESVLETPAAVARLLASSDVVVVPSQTETFSFTTAEALACETPVLGPAAGAVADLVGRSGGGVTFTPGSADDLAAAAIELLQRPAEARRALGRQGRAFVQQTLTWPAVMSRLRAVYESTVTS